MVLQLLLVLLISTEMGLDVTVCGDFLLGRLTLLIASAVPLTISIFYLLQRVLNLHLEVVKHALLIFLSQTLSLLLQAEIFILIFI